MSANLKRLVRLGSGLALAITGAACAPASNPPSVPISTAGQLVSQVVSQVNDAGRGASVVIDKDGNPVVSYILATQVLKKGEIAPAVVAGQPQPPAVLIATLQKGVWQAQSVTPQSTNPAQGMAPELVDSMGHALPGLSTSLAVDQQGTHHVVWSTPKGLFYAVDSGGSFGSPSRIVAGPVSGGAVAAAADGTSWVSFYSGNSLRVGSNTGGKWAFETADRQAGPEGAPATVTAIAVGGSGGPLVAYSAQGHTMLAAKATGGWTTQPVAGPGGIGVSMAMAKDGGSLLAYYDVSGGVHLAQPSGGSWTVSDLATTSPGPSGQGDPAWSTGLAADGQGKVYVTWADTAAKDVKLAMGAPGSLTQADVPDSDGGTNPSIAVSSDGKALALAYYDSTNANLNVATSPVPGQALAFQTPPLAPPTATAAPSGATCSPSGTTIQVVAKNIAFDKPCYAAPANTAFTIDFNNQDAGTMHNVDIYTKAPLQGGAHLAGAANGGDTITGPATTTYKVQALKPGTYFFQCDIHPSQMQGTFVVAK